MYICIGSVLFLNHFKSFLCLDSTIYNPFFSSIPVTHCELDPKSKVKAVFLIAWSVYSAVYSVSNCCAGFFFYNVLYLLIFDCIGHILYPSNLFKITEYKSCNNKKRQVAVDQIFRLYCKNVNLKY